jgi:hypothetical protein
MYLLVTDTQNSFIAIFVVVNKKRDASHNYSVCVCSLSVRRRIFKYPFRIFANPNTKHEFLLHVTLLVKSQVKVYFEVLRRVVFSYVACFYKVNGYRSNEVQGNATYQNHLKYS